MLGPAAGLLELGVQCLFWALVPRTVEQNGNQPENLRNVNKEKGKFYKFLFILYIYLNFKTLILNISILTTLSKS